MWTNWAGNQISQVRPEKPGSVAALQQLLASAPSVRPVGAGHSFTPLIPGADQIIDLSEMDLPLVAQVEGTRAWVNANARLRDLSLALAIHDKAFRNLGDINVQTLAGAASTATHGTGRGLPGIAAEITAARFVGADGQILDTDDIPLNMAQVTLGMLGILTEVQLNVVPKYNLRRRVRLTAIQDSLDSMHQSWADSRNFEFFYIPFTGKAVEIRHELTDMPATKAPRDLDMIAVKILKLARTAGRLSTTLRRVLLGLLTKAQSDEDYVGESWRVLCSDRHIRFKEMEYHLPPDNAQDVLTELIQRLERDHPDIYFPIEVRQTAGDNACLSPFQGGARVSIAIHTDAAEDHRRYFNAIEPMFLEAGGRPHWGKLHSLTYTELSRLYPDFEAFCTLRECLDPAGKLLTPALTRMFRP